MTKEKNNEFKTEGVRYLGSKNKIIPTLIRLSKRFQLKRRL